MGLSRRGFLKAAALAGAAAPLLFRQKALAQAKPASPIYIGVFADSEVRPKVHRHDKDGKTEVERLGEVCDDDAALGAVALVGCGDLISQSQPSFEVFKQVTEAPGRTVPIQYVFGNHDHWENFERTPILGHYGLKKMYRYLDVPFRVRLIFLADENAYGTANSNVSQMQAQWFEDAVRSHRGKCIVFSHQPRYDTIASSRSPGIFLAESGGYREQVEQTIDRCSAMFSGHVQHAHDYNRTRMDEIETQHRKKNDVWYFGLQSVIPSRTHLAHGLKEPDGTCWHNEYRVISMSRSGVYEQRRNFRTHRWVNSARQIA